VEDVEVSIVDEKTNTKIDLIKNNAYNTFSLAKNTNGTVRMEVNSAFGNENLPYGKDVTPFLTSGTLGGALNVINGAGAEFSASYTTSTALVPPWTDASNSFRGTLYYRGMLDAFAANLARTLNGVNDYNPNGALPRSVLVSSKDAGYDTTHANYNNIYDSSNPAYDADLYRQAVEDYRNALASGNPALIAAARPAYEQVLVSNPANKTQYDDKDPFYDQTLDPSNTSGTPPFDSTKYWDTINAYVPEPRPLFSTIDGSTTVTSANIRISQEWLDNPMRLTVTQPGDLSEGENVGRMIVAIEKGFAFYPDGDPTKPMLFNGTLEEYFTGVNATLGLDVSLYDNYSETSKQVMTTLFTARESVSGVSLDEEGVALMAYQKSYNAAVRFFTVLDEAVNKIINEMGLAGR
jgi:flagellar hook-associated protein 1 FlgK